MAELYLAHYGVKGMKWGVRRQTKRYDKMQEAKKAGNTKKYRNLSNRQKSIDSRRSSKDSRAKQHAKNVGSYALSSMGIGLASSLSQMLVPGATAPSVALGKAAIAANSAIHIRNALDIEEAMQTKQRK